MPDASIVQWIHERYAALFEDLDERGRRRWAAAEALSLGGGGIGDVAAIRRWWKQLVLKRLRRALTPASHLQ